MAQVNNTPKIVGGAVVSAVILIGLLFFVLGSEDASISSTQSVSTAESQAQQIDTDASASEALQETDTTDEQSTATSSVFVDGAYSASTVYASPGGNDGIGVEIVLANNQIQSLDIIREESNNTSVRWVDRFVAEVFTAVEGQDLDEADVDKLGGASLTQAAFNDLLDDIRSQALAS